MKLRTLTIVVSTLTAASAGVWFLNRNTDRATNADPRVGQPVADSAALADATAVSLTDAGQTVKLVRDERGEWSVASYHDLPADFAKLTGLVRGFVDAKVDRFVTATPEKIKRLGFGDTRVEFADKSGHVLWAADLGKTSDAGGRFLRFDGAPAAYLAKLGVWLDASSKNWADSALLSLKPADVARLEIALPDGSVVDVSRAKAEEPFVAAKTVEGETLKASAVTSLLNSLTGLRFTDTAANDAADVQAAREHTRSIKLTTFDGKTYDILMGRRPAVPAPAKPAEDKSKDAAAPAEPEQTGTPAGPVYAFITSSSASDKVNALMQKRAFQVAEFTFTGLPADHAALFETAPKAPTSSVGTATPLPAISLTPTTPELPAAPILPPVHAEQPAAATTPES